MSKIKNTLNQTGQAVRRNFIKAKCAGGFQAVLLVMGMVIAVLIGIALVGGIIFGFMALPALVLWLAWNYGMVAAFAVKPLSFWVVFLITWGLMVIAGFLKR